MELANSPLPRGYPSTDLIGLPVCILSVLREEHAVKRAISSTTKLVNILVLIVRGKHKNLKGWPQNSNNKPLALITNHGSSHCTHLSGWSEADLNRPRLAFKIILK